MPDLKGTDIRRTHLAKDLDSVTSGELVRITGWVEDIRPLGALAFMTVRDISGRAQAIFRKENAYFESAQSTPRQSVVVIDGTIRESKSRDFKIEIEANKLQVLSEAVHPLPIDPTGRVTSSIDSRIDSRALDLRNPKVAAIFKIRHTILQSIRDSFIKEGFLEISTAKVIGQAVEGGANLFGLNYFGKKAYLSQSPQLYKEQLTLSLDRVFEIASYFRSEKSHTSRHISEFTSVDIEAAFMDEYDVMRVAEKMIGEAHRETRKHRKEELEILGQSLEEVSTPFPLITYSQALDELRDDGLDLKFGDDLTDSALKRLGANREGYYFIVEWPTRLKPFYIDVQEGRPELSKGFDLQHGEIELASGGMRVSKRTDLEKRLKESNLNVAEFSPHLEVFDWGMPPHSGWGFGLDRFIMVLTGAKNIREVVLYPRDTVRLTP